MKRTLFLLHVLLLAFALPAWTQTQTTTTEAPQQQAQSNVQAQASPRRITDLRPTVILISLDGFRWDYPDRTPTPVIQKLIAEGARAERVIPIFPSKTFPNHYTLVTGMYAESHGMIANNMWDPEMPERFSMSKRDQVRDRRWWGGEPIWNTVQKQGQLAAAMFWPGSEAPVQGSYPEYWLPYNEEMKRHERVNQVLAWMDLPREKRPTFFTLYFEDTDTAGHDHGPESAQLQQAIRDVDAALGLLMEGLRARGVLDKVNVIVTSDHGMTATSAARSIFLDDHLDMNDADVIDWSPVLMLRSRSGKHEAIFEALVKAGRPLSVYRRQEVPKRYRFEHRRVPEIVAVADEGWSITTRKRLATRKKPELGSHGYDPALRSMHSFFVARGPAFRRGVVVPGFRNVDVYSLIAHLLRVKPAKTDGSLDGVRPLLRER